MKTPIFDEMLTCLENIQETNKLIAKFMGYDINRIVDELPVDINGNYTTHNNKYVYAPSLQYNSSWDWLMSVVEKIEYEYMYSVSPTWEHCVIINAGDNKDRLYIETEGRSKKEATYKAVVEFIKWYNKQQNK